MSNIFFIIGAILLVLIIWYFCIHKESYSGLELLEPHLNSFRHRHSQSFNDPSLSFGPSEYLTQQDINEVMN